MKKILTSLLFFMLVLSSQVTGQHTTHTVRAGETLFRISREYDVSVQQLREWNNLPDNTIRVGQRLVVGLSDEEEADPAEVRNGEITHTVEPGQTLFRLSRMYDVSVEEIQVWNNLEGTTISIGQELVIKTDVEPADEPVTDLPEEAPVTEEDPDTEEDRVSREDVSGEAARETPSYYEVRPGDTLYRIATLFNMTVEELKELNNLEDNLIDVGQNLHIRSRPSAPPSVTAEWDMESTPQGKFVSYTFDEEDTLDQLLAYHNMESREFRALNPGISTSDLRPGDEVTLLLPATASQRNPYRVDVSGNDVRQIEVTRYPETKKGETTTSGDLYNPEALTAAHPGLPLGSVVYIENPETGHGLFIHINDRTPENRMILSRAAYRALGYLESTRTIAEIHDITDN